MKLSLDKKQLMNYVRRQLDFYMPDDYQVSDEIMKNSLEAALERCENCFRHILLPGYREGKEAVFSHLHADQYATFLYFLGNTIWNTYQEKQLCDKLLNLNRILNGFFLSYKCPMPNVFILGHPIGSIIGNALYSDGLVVSQNVTVNTHTNEKGEIDLKIGRECFLGAGATIIGNGTIGDRVSIGVNALIYNHAIEDDSVCMNDKNELIIRQRKNPICKAARWFDWDI